MKKRFYFLPKTKIGKISLWLSIFGLIVIIILNVLANNVQCGLCPEDYRKDRDSCNPECYYSTPQCLSPSVETFCNPDIVVIVLGRTLKIIIGLLALGSIITSGVLSFVSIIKYRERALLIFIPAALGILGLIFLLGEIFIPH